MRNGLSARIPEPLTAEEEAVVLRLLGTKEDHRAREVLIEHNLRLVYWIVCRSYPEYPEPEELVSAGMLGLVKGVQAFEPSRGRSLGSYLGACIRNEIRMFLRKEERYLRAAALSDVEKSGTVSSCAGAGESGTAFFSEKDYLDRMAHAVRELPAREQDLLRQRYGMDGGEGATQTEVARKMSISQSYVSRMERRTLEKLRRKIED